jgi:spore germination cell wall hydrolase CwlJ-like protein
MHLCKHIASLFVFSLLFLAVHAGAQPINDNITQDVAAVNVIQQAANFYDSAEQIAQEELTCLSKNIYYEAGNQPFLGKVGVGVVTLNRANSIQFPNSICGVVKQKTKTSPGKVTCQFSWFCLPVKPVDTNSENWIKSLEAAQLLLSGGYKLYQTLFDGALFFHASYITHSPRAKSLYVVRVGEHIFYR